MDMVGRGRGSLLEVSEFCRIRTKTSLSLSALWTGQRMDEERDVGGDEWSTVSTANCGSLYGSTYS
jgi:hypothetical protein